MQPQLAVPFIISEPRITFSFPQSQRHDQYNPNLGCLWSKRKTSNLPNRCPAIMLHLPQPQLVDVPLMTLYRLTSFSLPQSQRQRQCMESVSRNTSQLPKRIPEILAGYFLVFTCTSNNNAPNACPAKLPRRRIQHKGRGYQYSTRARRLGNYKYSTHALHDARGYINGVGSPPSFSSGAVLAATSLNTLSEDLSWLHGYVTGDNNAFVVWWS